MFFYLFIYSFVSINKKLAKKYTAVKAHLKSLPSSDGPASDGILPSENVESPKKKGISSEKEKDFQEKITKYEEKISLLEKQSMVL